MSKSDDQLKRYRRVRGGRTLPRSGGGTHPDRRTDLLDEAAAQDLRDHDYDLAEEERAEEWRHGDEE